MTWHTGASDVFFCLSPILGLVCASTFTKWDTAVTLPLTALGMFLVRLMYLSMDPAETAAAIISGMHEACVPLSIIFGAVFLFKVMEQTGCMEHMTRKMVAVTGGHRVAQLMLLGWSFMTLLEGCSGFGTPLVAIAPVLTAIGHDKVSAILFLLISNSLVTAFGATGTPLWYGLGQTGVPDSDLVETGFVASTGLALASLIFLPAACAMCTSWRETREVLPFVLLSALSSAVPLVATAYVSYTFPAIIAGLAGCVCTYLLIKFNVGIKRRDTAEELDSTWAKDLKMTLPITATVLLLLLTRIPQIGVKDIITRTTPAVTAKLGSYGDVSLSASLVFQLRNILTVPDVSFKFQLLYVPFILPFVVVGAATLIAFRATHAWRGICKATMSQLKHPAQTLLGALVLVELMVVGGESSPASVIGTTLSTAMGDAWVALAPLLGSLGSFVAGSTTVSNLTFGTIQYTAATNVGLDYVTVLALQCCGASIGTAICIFHIIACGASIGEQLTVSQFMKRLGPMVLAGDMLVMGVVLGVGALLQ